MCLGNHAALYLYVGVAHRSKSASPGDPLRMFVVVHLASLLRGRLAGGEPPWLLQDLAQKWRVQLEVLGDNVETEQMPVDAVTGHGLLVTSGMAVSGYSQQSLLLLVL